MKIVFMGTPDFAVGALSALREAGHEITLVVTQPDKPKGRGKEISKSPVKLYAEEWNIPTFQPVKIRLPESVEELKKAEADVFVVAAFGQILTKEILEMPKYGCINIHASLLPMYRGAAPIQWVLINGEKKAGVTIMQMDEGLDTGDMLLTGEIDLAKDETADTLHDKLMHLGGELIVEALKKLEEGTLSATPQPEGPQTTVTLSSGNWASTFFRLCNLQPRTEIKLGLLIFAARLLSVMDIFQRGLPVPGLLTGFGPVADGPHQTVAAKDNGPDSKNQEQHQGQERQ